MEPSVGARHNLREVILCPHKKYPGKVSLNPAPRYDAHVGIDSPQGFGTAIYKVSRLVPERRHLPFFLD